MKLSIITINYNNKAGLEKTIASVMSQTWRDFEWIIIDGGSTDGSKEVIEGVASDPNSNISYWCSEPDKGIYNALNKGLSYCSGVYTLCLNSGDLLYDESTLKSVFTKDYEDDVIFGDCLLTDGEKEEMRNYKDDVDIYFLYKYNICHQAMFVRTCKLQENGFNEKYKIVADYVMWLQLINDFCSFRHINVPVCRYDTTGLSSDPKFNLQHKLEREDAQDKYIPMMTMIFLQRCDEYERQQDFVDFINIKQNGGFTYKILLKFFVLVRQLAKLKQSLHPQKI